MDVALQRARETRYCNRDCRANKTPELDRASALATENEKKKSRFVIVILSRDRERSMSPRLGFFTIRAFVIVVVILR